MLASRVEPIAPGRNRPDDHRKRGDRPQIRSDLDQAVTVR